MTIRTFAVVLLMATSVISLSGCASAINNTTYREQRYWGNVSDLIKNSTGRSPTTTFETRPIGSF